MRCLALLLIVMLMVSCKKEATPPKHDSPASNATPPAKAHNAPGTIRQGDTLTILQRCAVQFVHDTLQLEKMHRQMGDDFYTVADDANFYNAEAAAFLDSVKLPIRYVKDVKYIEFQNNYKTSRFVKTDTLSLFNLFLFDPAKPLPQPVDITAIREDYRRFEGSNP